MRYTSGLRSIFLALILAAWCSAAEPAKLDTSTPVGQAFARMYSLDFQGAHRILDRQIQQEPRDPLLYSVKAAAYLFSEMDRLEILQIEFFEDDDKVVTRQKLAPDPSVRAEFFRLLETARQHANARLSAQPDDRDSLFALCMAAGLETDYAGLIERRRFGTFILARQTQAYIRKLQALTPPVYDAYLATGTTEYVVGSIPFYFRWLVHIDNISGNKQKGIEILQLVAEKGRYYSPFARVLLAAVYMREKQYTEAERLLSRVSAEYPENPIFHKELQRASQLRSRVGLTSRAGGAAR
jgi:tetratricopeptide (TPR) repeat protein